MKKLINFNPDYFKNNGKFEITPLPKLMRFQEEWMNEFKAKRVYENNNIYIYKVEPDSIYHPEYKKHVHYEIFEPKLIPHRELNENGFIEYSKNIRIEAYPFTKDFSETGHAYQCTNLKDAIKIAKSLEKIKIEKEQINKYRTPRFTNIDLIKLKKGNAK